MNESPEGMYVPDVLHDLADKIDNGDIRVERATVEPKLREATHSQEIKIERDYRQDTVIIEVVRNGD